MYRLGSRLFSIVALGMVAPATEAQDAAKVHMHADSGYAADGLLFEPAGTGPFAALLVIHDEWGLTDRVTDQARRFARAGFVVVAVDLYRGEVAPDAQRAAQLSARLSADGARHDLEAAMMFIAAQPNVRHGFIGAVGWSAGAAAALRLAAEGRQVLAVVVNGCEPPTGVPVKGAPIAVLGNFGGCHSAVSPAAVKNFENELTAVGFAVSTKVYAADRNLEQSSPPDLRGNDARDADARTLQFLASALGGPCRTAPPPQSVTPH